MIAVELAFERSTKEAREKLSARRFFPMRSRSVCPDYSCLHLYIYIYIYIYILVTSFGRRERNRRSNAVLIRHLLSEASRVSKLPENGERNGVPTRDSDGRYLVSLYVEDEEDGP